MPFCKDCGNQIPEDRSTCPNCQNGTSTGTGKPLSQMTFGEMGQTVTGAFNVSDEDTASLTIAGKTVKIATALKIIAIALFVIFFFPLFTVSCSNTSINFNGMNAVFGKTVEVMGEKSKIDGSFIVIILLLVPAAQFAAIHFKKNFEFIKGKLYLISTALSVLGLIGFMFLTSEVNKKAEESMATVKYTFWYYLSIILYIVAGIVSLMCVISSKKNSTPPLPPNEYQNNNQI